MFSSDKKVLQQPEISVTLTLLLEDFRECSTRQATMRGVQMWCMTIQKNSAPYWLNDSLTVLPQIYIYIYIYPCMIITYLCCPQRSSFASGTNTLQLASPCDQPEEPFQPEAQTWGIETLPDIPQHPLKHKQHQLVSVQLHSFLKNAWLYMQQGYNIHKTDTVHLFS